MVSKILGLAGWPALIIIAVAIVVAQFMASNRWIHRGLWTVAAIVALIGAFNEWTKGS